MRVNSLANYIEPSRFVGKPIVLEPGIQEDSVFIEGLRLGTLCLTGDPGEEYIW